MNRLPTRHSLQHSLVVVVAATLLFAVSAVAVDAFFPRYPAVSPDGSIVVFSFQGDLWKMNASGGTAMRLTIHPAYERDPIFSPDGKWIVFASDRYGGFDLFKMPVDGGIPERMTWAQATDIPQDWLPDGSSILFATRSLFQYPMDFQINKLPATGGTPFRFADCFADEVAVSPDG